MIGPRCQVSRAGILYWSTYECQNIKLRELEVTTLTHNDTHFGHVPCSPLSISIQCAGDSLGKEDSMPLSFSEVLKILNATTTLGSTDLQ